MAQLDPPRLIEQLRYAISRYDQYYDTVNNKGAFFVALNTAIVGGLLLLQFEYAGKAFPMTPWIECMLTACLMLCLFSMATTLFAILPFTRQQSRSNIFFRSVAERSLESFREDINTETEKEAADDLIAQAHELSIGLRRKFRLLRAASFSMVVSFLAAILLTCLIMNNLTPPTP
jgi:hypothetical protein